MARTREAFLRQTSAGYRFPVRLVENPRAANGLVPAHASQWADATGGQQIKNGR